MPAKLYRLSLSACVLFVGVALAGLALASLKQLAPLEVPVAQNLGAKASDEIPAAWWATVQENLRRETYAFNPGASVEKIYHANNLAQRLHATFAPEGLRLSSLNDKPSPATAVEIEKAASQSKWNWNLRLTAYGVAGKDPQPLDAPQLTTQGDRLEYHYSAPIVEWYLNDPRGLEQGFTLLKHEGADTSSATFFLDLTLTTDLKPTLSADGQTLDFTDLNGAPVLRYDHLYASDATGRELAAYLTLLPKEKDNQPLTLRLNVDTTGAIYPLTIDPLTTAPNWTATGESNGDDFGASLATAGDVNGDGYSDVIVGSSYDTGGGNVDEGRVYLYHGTANGLSLTPAFTATGEGFANFFGSSVGTVGTAGDVNGDGYADVIIGALGYGGNIGRAYIYHGSGTGLNATPALTLTGEAGGDYFGSHVATAGDVNGDGYSDVIIGANGYNTNTGRAYVYHGSGAGLNATPAITFTGEVSFDYFSSAVGTAGDVNGDGYSDIVIGAYGYATTTGRAYVYHGSGTGLSATPVLTATGANVYASLGVAAGTAGDVNGDGYSDVLIGASGYVGSDPFKGRAYLYLGSASGLTTSTLIATGEGNNDQMGSAVGTAGDMNGDGYADVIIGAHRYPNDAKTGRAYLYTGQATGLSTSPILTFTGQITDSRLGVSVGTAGDVNGDGYADLLLGEPGPFTTAGQAYVYLGSANPLSDVPVFTTTGENVDDVLGYSVATAGDVNGDGYADVIIGAPNYLSITGRVYLYTGSITGLNATPAITLTGKNEYDGFGASVGTAGDVNGDGYADVIIGASGCSCGTGQAYVYTGSASGLSATPVFTAAGEMAGDLFGESVGSAGDVNGDGYADVVIGALRYLTFTGRIYVYLGQASGVNAAPVFTATGENLYDEFGISVGTAGDVNRDGYADVIAGAPGYNDSMGRVYLYQGGPTGLSATPVFTATGENPFDNFGISVGTAGDINGDSYADVIVGAYFYFGEGDDLGRAYVYTGTASGLSATPDFVVTSENFGDYLGNSVGTAGDVNGDGYADVIIGAYGYDSGDFQGRAYLHTGSATGLSATPALTLTGENSQDDFGGSVGTAGDVNGDGYAEFIVGAYRYANDDYQGRAYVYAGNGSYGVSVRPQQRRNDNGAPIAPSGQSESLSGFRIAALGRSPFGRGKVKLEWEVKPLGTAFNGASTQKSAAWLDSGTAGAALNELVTGLSTGTHYHWRVRVLYHPATTPFQSYSRWFTQPWNGWQENDLLTADQVITGLAAANNSPKYVLQSVAFTATVTTGTQVTYLWNFGDGQTGTGITATHTYSASGVYTSTLTALNSDSVISVTKPVTITLLKLYLPIVRR